MEELLFESESTQSRASIAEYLRTVAEKLDADDPIVLRSGDSNVTLDPPERPTFEVKAEREDETELSIEFELEWKEGADSTADGDLRIE